MGEWSSKAAELITVVADQITDLAKPTPSPDRSEMLSVAKFDFFKSTDHSRGMGE